MDKKVRTIVIDGVEIQTSLTAVEIADLAVKNADLQQRIDKAIEYINNTTLSNDWYNFYKKELLNILKGDDKNVKD